MLVRNWQPLAEMNRLRDEMERVFGRCGNGSSRTSTTKLCPPVNVWEDSDQLFVEAELPGFELDDLEIYMTAGDQLSIKGERKAPQFEQGAWHRQERGYGSFCRTIELSATIDSNTVSAELKHGVLTITLPKSEAVKPRRIEVKTS